MKQYLFGAALAILAAGAAHAQAPAAPAADAAPEGRMMQLEFIQQAAGMDFSGDTLTLREPAAATIVSAKGADASTGIMTTEEFVKAFAEHAGPDTKDAPNAMVVVVGSDQEPAIVELSEPELTDGALVYKVAVLEGELPASADNVTVFIDPWIHVPAYRPWRAPVVVVPGRFGPGPRCHFSPYYYGNVCRW